MLLGPSSVDLLGCHRSALSSRVSQAHSQDATGCCLASPLLPPLLLDHSEMMSMQSWRVFLLRGSELFTIPTAETVSFTPELVSYRSQISSLRKR